MSWTITTEPDERSRCCVWIDEVRCRQPSTRKIVGTPRAWDDYVYVCGDHVALVLASAPGLEIDPICHTH